MVAEFFHAVLVTLWVAVALVAETLRLYVQSRERQVRRGRALALALLPTLHVLYTLCDLLAAPILGMRDTVDDAIYALESYRKVVFHEPEDANTQEVARWCDAYQRATGVLAALLDREVDAIGAQAAAETMHADIDAMLAEALTALGVESADEREHADDDGLPVAIDWAQVDLSPNQNPW